MIGLIPIFIFVPLAGFFLSLFINEKKEVLLSSVATYTTGLQLFGAVVWIIIWLIQGQPTYNIKEFSLYSTARYNFFIDFYFDHITAVYLIVGALLTFLIVSYSRYYMHRETGYKRFFNTLLFFFIGYNITIFSGNFETLFIGWEILGFSSFMLIAFYRNRYLPVKNAEKVFATYRIGDVGILLAMWASHHLWHENVTFQKMNDAVLVHEHLNGHSAIGIFIALMLLIAATAKSAQLPFSAWLPRAMEGPTPSSAIFYGSLSVHFGAFLLMRTYPFWKEQTLVVFLIIGVGIATSIITTLIARVQSTAKSQIAYSSIAQIGLIFVEVALGFHYLALFHFAGNAFLRTYQLLVSPSSVSYLVREQFYRFVPKKQSFEDRLPVKFSNTLYTMSLKEWNLDKLVGNIIFSPLKKLGHQLDFLTIHNVLYYFLPVYLLGLFMLIYEDKLPSWVKDYLPILFLLVGLMMVLKAYAERVYPRLAWLLLIMNHFWVVLALSFHQHFNMEHTLLYLGGVLVAGSAGYFILERLRQLEPTYFNLGQYFGHVYEHPKLAFLFLLTCLGLMGFPITPTFIGEDLIFSHIEIDNFFAAFFNALGFIVGGIAIIRIYARLFLGQHVKTYHETPYKSS